MILLDTHVVIWLAEMSPKLSKTAINTIEEARQNENGLAIASVTLWEIAMMATRDRIQLADSLESFLQTIESSFIVLSLTGSIARRSMEFTGHYPSDPMDRIIGATALVEGLSLITRDDAIRSSKEVPCIW